jgi:epoxyqueuosine reductase QueG
MYSISEEIKEYIKSLGADLVGFANLHEIPYKNRWGYNYGISIAVAYKPETLLRIPDIPNDIYYKEYKFLDEKLEQIALETERYLKRNGFDAKAINRSNRCLDEETKTSLLPYKTVATRAGLGWIGKCALLINEEYGAGIRLISVLTNAPIETNKPMNVSKCGDCSICVDMCPSKAPVGVNWQLGMERSGIFDAFKCRDYIAERGIQYEYGRTTVTCGLCILACPWTKKYIKRHIEGVNK